MLREDDIKAIKGLKHTALVSAFSEAIREFESIQNKLQIIRNELLDRLDKTGEAK